MNMYKLIKYSDNYSDSAASLYHFKMQEQTMQGRNIVDLTDTSESFKYKSKLLKGLTHRDVGANVDPNIAGAHRV